MKNIVIFGYNMDMGGAEKALINVLNLIVSKANVTLILLEKTGILMKDIPSGVEVKEIGKRNVRYLLFRFLPFYRKYLINKLTSDKHYDLAVAFMEGRAATFVADMRQNCKKIAWIHNDVNVFDIGISDREIINSYRQMDSVIAVSKHSQKSFCDKYGFSFKKVKVIYNMLDEEKILKMSKTKKVKKRKFTFVNVARMREQKRIDRLINVAHRLKKDGYDFDLWLIGGGPLEAQMQEMIKTYSLEDCVKSFGLLENPYPYVLSADYFVMSSDHEGYPLSLLESLLLKTKVITTDVSGAKEILESGKYGYIVPISEDALYQKMKEVLDGIDDSKIDKALSTYKGKNEIIKKEILKEFSL